VAETEMSRGEVERFAGENARSGKWLARYVTQWPKSDSKRGKASFSVGL
jgi:hypothetical protein